MQFNSEQQKYLLIGSVGGLVLGRVFDTGFLGSLILIGAGAFIGFKYEESLSSKKDDLSQGKRATDEEGKIMIKLVNESTGLNYSDNQQADFIKQYAQKISEKEHDLLVQLVKMDYSKFTKQQKEVYSKMVDILKDIVIQKD